MILTRKRRKLDFGSFSYADQGEESGAKQSVLTWRLDPEESFSDWTIEVTTVNAIEVATDDLAVESAAKRTENDNVVETVVYHVHRHMLGAGQRSSLYFSRMFRSNMAETSTCNSAIELDEAAAKAFPLMLDFMYSQHELHATTDSVASLRYLANYFGVKSLFDAVNNFIEQDIGYMKLSQYINGAMLYQDEKLLDAVQAYILVPIPGSNDDQLQRTLLEFPPAFFSRIIRGLSQTNKKFVIPEAIADYCLRHTTLETSYIQNITLEDTLPKIKPEFAFRLINLAVQRNIVEAVDGKPSLKQRSIETAARHWFHLSKKFGFDAATQAATEEGMAKQLDAGYAYLSSEVKQQIMELATGYRQQTEATLASQGLHNILAAFARRFNPARNPSSNSAFPRCQDPQVQGSNNNPIARQGRPLDIFFDQDEELAFRSMFELDANLALHLLEIDAAHGNVPVPAVFQVGDRGLDAAMEDFDHEIDELHDVPDRIYGRPRPPRRNAMERARPPHHGHQVHRWPVVERGEDHDSQVLFRRRPQEEDDMDDLDQDANLIPGDNLAQPVVREVAEPIVPQVPRIRPIMFQPRISIEDSP